ncbi:hypothetical protein UFOVP1419_9 [uncultured Caudovirales phage]|uniref:Uncharacterized protein n=1 Tax=uncultured Caudovirales phage TaxID=2100421 RepID=A0A6J5SDC0_9CAUD|nr:hypothetical protein UFOVP1419_9 [uncultured Caudovirales phage]
MSEQHVDIASKLYSARRSLRSLCPDVFVDRCKEWQEAINAVAASKGMTGLQAMIDIMTRLEGREVAQMWVMAAYVEMVEPS